MRNSLKQLKRRIVFWKLNRLPNNVSVKEYNKIISDLSSKIKELEKEKK